MTKRRLRAVTTGGKPDYLRTVVRAVLAILAGIQLSAWLTFLPFALRGHADFRPLYVAGAMVRSGQAGQLYDYQAQKRFQDQLVRPEETALPFDHLAYEALFYVPFSILSCRAA